MMAGLRSCALCILVACGCSKQNAAVPLPAPAPKSTSAAGAEPPAGERVENPTYTAWAKFPVGTTVVQQSVTEELGNPNKTVTTVRFKLAERTDTGLTVELKTTTKRYDGLVLDNPPDRLRTDRHYILPAGASKPSPSKVDAREDVTVAGKLYPCRLVRSKASNEGGEVLVRTWSSDDMPGGLVKSVTETPGVKKVVSIEVVEVVVPDGK